MREVVTLNYQSSIKDVHKTEKETSFRDSDVHTPELDDLSVRVDEENQCDVLVHTSATVTRKCSEYFLHKIVSRKDDPAYVMSKETKERKHTL